MTRPLRRVEAVIVVLLLFATTPSAGQSPTPSSGIPPGERWNITATDGITLAAELRAPDGGGAHPAIILAHGFGQDRRSLARLAASFTAQGFLTVAYDARGFGESGGLVNLDGPKEVGDVGRIIEALSKRSDVVQDENGNPRVGLYGTSYGGAVQLMAAARDRRVDAVVVQSSWNNLTAALFPGGVLNRDAVALLFAFGVRAASATGPGVDPELLGLYNRTLAGNLTITEAMKYLDPRSPATTLAELKAPVLLLHGRSDGLFPPLHAGANYRALHAAGVPVGLVVGPGGHGRSSATPPATAAADAIVASWWTHWLVGTGDSGLLENPVLAWDDATARFIPSTVEAAEAPPPPAAPPGPPKRPVDWAPAVGLLVLAALGFVLSRRRP